MNNVSLVGRLTRDVDLRYTKNGKAVGNFNLAVNRPFKNANGEQEADFINCQAWGKQAENLANYMKKGNQISLVGRIQTRNYENKEGQRVYVTEVVADNIQFLESKTSTNADNQNQYNGRKQPSSEADQFNQQQDNGGPYAPTTNTQQGYISNPNAGQLQQNQSQGHFQGQGQPLDIQDDDLPF